MKHWVGKNTSSTDIVTVKKTRILGGDLEFMEEGMKPSDLGNSAC
jgi:hypothetical protein